MGRSWDKRVNESGQLTHIPSLEAVKGKGVWVTIEEVHPREKKSPGRLMWELSGAASELWDRGSDEMRERWEDMAIAVADAVQEERDKRY